MTTATLPAVAFQTVSIIGKAFNMGVLLADGSVILQRRGSGEHLEATVRGVNVSIHPVAGRPTLVCELFYQRGEVGPQKVARETYHYLSGDTGTLPCKLISESLDWIAQQTEFRPSGFRPQRAAYTFDHPRKPEDLVLQRFRYDQSSRSIVEAQSGATVARAAGDGSPFVFDPEMIDVLAGDHDAKDSIQHVLDHCFALSDRHVGFHHCMHRLAGRASNAYARLKGDQTFEVFVLRADALSPAVLEDIEYASDVQQCL